MDFDFHYYATYSAARFAGYAPEQASKIAKSAQFVDEFSKGNFDGVITNPSYTAFDFKLSDYLKQGIINDTQLAQIWMPYHFLPAFANERSLIIGDNKDLNGDMNREDYKIKFRADLTDIHLKCITLPNGILYDDVVSLRGVEGNDLLAIGLKMHVLADTYAHQGFVGYKKKDVNCLTGQKIMLGKGETPSKVWDAAGIGHAPCGHYPDYGYAWYQYHPAWADAEKAYVNRNNPEIFAYAYIAMAKAMNAHRNANVSNQYQIILTQDDIKTRWQEIKNLLTLGDDDVVSREEASLFQEKEWCEYTLKKDDELTDAQIVSQMNIEKDKKEILEYFKNQSNIGELRFFNAAANAHKNMVSQRMKENIMYSLEEFPESM
ncbi:MAG: DUF6765 family protein [Bacillota bacterium]